MRQIPEFYPITFDEYKQSQILEGKPIDPNVEFTLKQAQLHCDAYKKEIEKSVDLAYKTFFATFSHQKLVYSRTWGKS
jgi:hypothetical protein